MTRDPADAAREAAEAVARRRYGKLAARTREVAGAVDALADAFAAASRVCGSRFVSQRSSHSKQRVWRAERRPWRSSRVQTAVA